MNTETTRLVEEIRDAYEGDPWWGRNAKTLIGEVTPEMAVQKPGGQHSILELVWHMNNWKEFAISRLRAGDKDLHYFETNDWRALDHGDASLWPQGVARFHQLHGELLEVIGAQNDALLGQNVAERTYSFRKLLHGILQHDIYHLGQVAYVVKMLRG